MKSSKKRQPQKSTHTTTRQKEQSTGTAKKLKNANANYSDDPKQLIQKIGIPGTPLTLIKVENKWFVSMGKYRLSEPYDDILKAAVDAETITLYRIMQITQIQIEDADRKKSEKYIEQQMQAMKDNTKTETIHHVNTDIANLKKQE